MQYIVVQLTSWQSCSVSELPVTCLALFRLYSLLPHNLVSLWNITFVNNNQSQNSMRQGITSMHFKLSPTQHCAPTPDPRFDLAILSPFLMKGSKELKNNHMLPTGRRYAPPMVTKSLANGPLFSMWLPRSKLIKSTPGSPQVVPKLSFKLSPRNPQIMIWWLERQLRWPEEFNEAKRPVEMSEGVDWGSQGVLGGQGGHLGDPLGPSGWFDESSDDSWGIYASIKVIQVFLANKHTYKRTEVFREALNLADLKIVVSVLVDL